MAADERAEIIDAARELLAWEEELGGIGVPAVAVPARRGPVAPERRLVHETPAGEPARPARPAAPARPASAPPAAPPVASPASGDRAQRLRVLQEEAASCTRCRLHQGRNRSVFARGNPNTDLVFVGEGPGYHEDQKGLPFVGNAGALLDRMVQAMGYPRDGVYICNVVKCRPPENRTPKPDEAGACKPYLVGQLEAVRPKVIVALGRCAAENLGQVEPDGRGWRGRWGEYEGIPVMSTYHPAFLLRSPQFKRPVWEDLQAVLRKLGRPIP